MSRSFLLRRLSLLYGLLLALVLARLVQLQVVEHEAWRAEAIRARSSGRTLPFTRGRILDRRGEILAEDRRTYSLRFDYRTFRRGHPAGQAFEAALLAGLPVAGLEDAWARAEELTASLLAVPAEALRALSGPDRGDLLYYLAKLAGLPSSRNVELDRWAQEGHGPCAIWPDPASGWRARLADAREAWERLGRLLPDEPLMGRIERERRALELRIRLLALREAAGLATGRTRGQVVAALAADSAERDVLLAELAERWGLPPAPAGEPEIAALLARSHAPGGSEESWMRRAGESLRQIEARRPDDLAGVRRRLVREVHGSWNPILAEDLAWRLVDLVSQDPDRYPGLAAEEEHLRSYRGAVDPHLLGYLRQPGPDELEAYQILVAQRRELARVIDRSAAQQAELQRLDRLLVQVVRRPDDLVPVQGVEWSCEDDLAGRRGLLRRLRWDEDEPLELEFLPPVNGGDVRLALDGAWCEAARRAIARGYELAPEVVARRPGGAALLAQVEPLLAAPRAGLILIDLRDGSVPVAVTTPGYDANEFRRDLAALEQDPERPLRHRALGSATRDEQIPYPGSTFKLVAALVALEQDLAWWERRFTCERTFFPDYPGGPQLSCTGQHGELDLRGAIRESCNIYFYQLAAELGFDAISTRAAELGFGQRTTGLDLTSTPGPDGQPLSSGHLLEIGSRLHPVAGRASSRGLAAMRLAIGQTYVEASPLQMARVYAWLACGRLWQPRMVLERDGRPTAPAWSAPPLDRRVRELLVEALLDVTGPEGTAYDSSLHRYQLADFAVAGKTGTAQIGRGPDGREYPYHAWFAGFFPVSRAGEEPVTPRYAAAVLCENTGLHGGWIANYVLALFLEEVGEELLR